MSAPSRTYVALVAGGIASGKSTLARAIERLGGRRIDLDQLSRDVLAPNAETTRRVAATFGEDLLDPTTGALDRRALARRVFGRPDALERLETIELPAIRARLSATLARAAADGEVCCVVEVPLLDRLGDAREHADEAIAVVCPYEERRERAVRRGMTSPDFDARAARQPSDEWLRAHADTVFVNDGDEETLVAFARSWWDERIAPRKHSFSQQLIS